MPKHSIAVLRHSPSPLATMNEMPTWRMRVKKAIPFSKKWLATCMTPEAC